nr:unnamed protein product [Callosobruchus chinensis]
MDEAVEEEEECEDAALSEKEECEVHHKGGPGNAAVGNGHVCQIMMDDPCILHANGGIFDS